MTAGEKSPEITNKEPEDTEKEPEEQFTILNWMKAHYRPPPLHPNTMSAFGILCVEYISTFEVDEEVPIFSIGRYTDDLRFEMFSF